MSGESRATVADVIGQSLVAAGLRVAFAVCGSGNLVATDAVLAAGARVYTTRHESGAVSAADAYARTAGGVGLASVHQGPGLTNALTSLTEAVKSRTPLVLITGETPAEARGSNFRIDQSGVVTALGAGVEVVTDPQTAATTTKRAVFRARVERRPIVLMMPIDVQDLPAKKMPEEVREPAAPFVPGPNSAAVRQIADLIATADRPVIIAGRGAALSKARASLEELAARIGALVATTAVAKGFFSGNPHDLGLIGGYGSPVSMELLPEADLVLSFGASLSQRTTRTGTYFSPHARLVHIDIDPEAIGRLTPVDVGLVSDADAAARAVLAELDRLDISRDGFRADERAAVVAKRRWRDEPYVNGGSNERMDPRDLTIALDDLLPTNRTVALDSGHFMGFVSAYLEVADPSRFVFTQAFQSVGLGLASAIGSSVARPTELTVAAIGDGGLHMSLAELETVARYELPLLIVVYNDAAYGAEVHLFADVARGADLVTFPDTDFVRLARGFGIEAHTVRSRGDLDVITNWLASPNRGPLLIDAKTTINVAAEWIQASHKAS